MKDSLYMGIHEDTYGGMTPAGALIKDAWVLGVLPESADGKGWGHAQMLALNEKVMTAWAPYGSMVSNLPPDLRERHTRIYDAAIAKARTLGWPPQLDDED